MKRFILIAGCVVLGCDAAPAPVSHLPDATVDAVTPIDGLCPVTVSLAMTESTGRVFVAGEWNNFSQTADPLTDDGTGRYTRTLRLAPGLYAYKFFFEMGATWEFDPAHLVRAYVDGVENSGLRVADCTDESFVVRSSTASAEGTFEASVQISAPEATVSAELLHDGARRELSSSELSVVANDATVSLSGLASGKYTVRLYTSGADVLLPFWIEAEPFSWSDAVIYMVVTDRFRDGDPSNNPPPNGASPGGEWVGGDLQGVTAAINDGYFDDLGVNALWLTPFNTNAEGVFADADGVHQVSGYHGYWPKSPTEVDPRIGGEDALREMMAAAHARGIRVLMDLVANHVHEEHPYVAAHPDWFNEGCLCGTDGCDWTARRLDCLFRTYMPDVDWTNKQASEQWLADSLDWLEDYDLDGFRVDAVKHVVDGAVFNLAERVRERFETAGTQYFLMGETAMGWDSSSGPEAGGNVENYGTISRYVGPQALNGQFDFVLYYAASLAFLSDADDRGLAHVQYWSEQSTRQFPQGAVMTPYIGSHDTPRFMTLASAPDRAGNKWDNLPPAPDTQSPYDRMYVALGWLFQLPGAPLLYYGDEYGEYGGSDPDNRHLMRFGADRNKREQAQAARVSALVTARRALPGLRSSATESLYVDHDLSVAVRGQGADRVIAVLYRGTTARDVQVAVPTRGAEEGAVLRDAISGQNVSVTRASIQMRLQPWSVAYFH